MFATMNVVDVTLLRIERYIHDTKHFIVSQLIKEIDVISSRMLLLGNKIRFNDGRWKKPSCD